MHRFLASLLLPLLLAACGGGGSTPSLPIPEAQASAADDGCPVGDATKQLQAMIDKAKGKLVLPACVFNVSEPIYIRKPLHLEGSGANIEGTIIRSTALWGLIIEPAAPVSIAACGPTCRGYFSRVKDLRVESATPGLGKNALLIRVKKDLFINNWMIDSVYLGGFGEAALYLDNSVGNVDGIFTGSVRNSFIEGFRCDNCGDSITLDNNVIPDSYSRRSSGGQPGIALTMVGGSRQFVISRNNISASGGCLDARGAGQVTFEQNWCEHQTTQSSGAEAAISLQGVFNSTLVDNTTNIGKSGVKYTMVIDGGSLNDFARNDFDPGTLGHVDLRGGTRDNSQSAPNRYRTDSGYRPAGKVIGADTGLIKPN